MSDEYALGMNDVAASVRRFDLREVVEVQCERVVAINDMNQIRASAVDEQDLPCD